MRNVNWNGVVRFSLSVVASLFLSVLCRVFSPSPADSEWFALLVGFVTIACVVMVGRNIDIPSRRNDAKPVKKVILMALAAFVLTNITVSTFGFGPDFGVVVTLLLGIAAWVLIWSV